MKNNFNNDGVSLYPGTLNKIKMQFSSCESEIT